MKSVSDRHILVLEGEPRERGLIYGRTTKLKIREVIERLKYHIEKNTHKSPNKLLNLFVDATDFVDAVKKWAPHLLEEVEGIGEGADVDFNTIFALQCSDEHWLIQEYLERKPVDRCSALGCFKEGDSPALLAQNLDVNSIFEGLDVVLHIKHLNSPLESLIFTYAGKISLCGVNNSPLGICCNELTMTLNHRTDGLPEDFVVRTVLEQPSMDEAMDFIQRVSHASGQNYIIGDEEKVTSLECSANKVSQYTPYQGARRVCHTNHPLVNDDLVFPLKTETEGGTTYSRFKYLESRLKDPASPLTVETIKYLLSSHQGPICVHHDNQAGDLYTFGSVIYSLSKPPELYLATGPPCSNDYKKLSF
jgi:predicted choloylglycine hydrolase